MKHSFAVLVLACAFAVSCEKNESDLSSERDMRIVQTTTPPVVSKGTDITSSVRCEAPNLCYVFSRFHVVESEDNAYHIQAKALFPNPLSGSVACAQAIYRVDTILRVATPRKGTYLLKFYNGKDLFKTDTVLVNYLLEPGSIYSFLIWLSKAPLP